MRLVRLSNPTYERMPLFGRSVLRPLIAILKDPNGTANQVVQAIDNLTRTADAQYRNKANKYKEALYFLQHDYPIPTVNRVSINPQASEAVRFTQTPVPPGFNQFGPAMYGHTDRLVAPSASLHQTIEEFIYTAPAIPAVNIGIVMIHLGAFQQSMLDRYDGWRVLDHMNSVLRVGWNCHCDLCILHMGAQPEVCPELDPEVSYFFHRVTVHELGHAHMGNSHPSFLQFMQTHNPVVVMGFDANICVRANLFGTNEYMPHIGPGPDPHTPVPPIVSVTDVVTSRAVLVCNGPIYPVNHQGEYGVLFNT
jgi:hypothetical protein